MFSTPDNPCHTSSDLGLKNPYLSMGSTFEKFSKNFDFFIPKFFRGLQSSAHVRDNKIWLKDYPLNFSVDVIFWIRIKIGCTKIFLRPLWGSQKFWKFWFFDHENFWVKLHQNMLKMPSNWFLEHLRVYKNHQVRGQILTLSEPPAKIGSKYSKYWNFSIFQKFLKSVKMCFLVFKFLHSLFSYA